jgi:hypothetical protein
VTGKNLRVSAAASILGASGGVHANGNLTITSSPTITTDATASGAYTVTGAPSIQGATGGGTPLEPIPVVQPADFYAYRDYLLASNGKVYDKNGVVQPMTGSTWKGWSYSYGVWYMDNSTPINGTLYVQGDVSIHGHHGRGVATNPWIATIIATGSIDVDVRKNLTVRAPRPTDGNLYHPETKDILFLAGGDVEIDSESNVQQNFQGLLIAYEQVGIEVETNLVITGSIMAQDLAAVHDEVVGNSGIFLDNPGFSRSLSLTYNGDLGVPFPGAAPVQLMTWQVMQ